MDFLLHHLDERGAHTELSHAHLSHSFEKWEVHEWSMKEGGGGQKKSFYARQGDKAVILSGR